MAKSNGVIHGQPEQYIIADETGDSDGNVAALSFLADCAVGVGKKYKEMQILNRSDGTSILYHDYDFNRLYDPFDRQMLLSFGDFAFGPARGSSINLIASESMLSKAKKQVKARLTIQKDLVVTDFFMYIASIEELEDPRDIFLKIEVGRMRLHHTVISKEGGGDGVALSPNNRIDIKKLKSGFGKRFFGKYVLLRTITFAINTVYLEVVVEDPTGNGAAALVLANFTQSTYSKNVNDLGRKNEGNRFLAEWMPVGVYVVVKHPFVSCTSKAVAIFTNNPCDVMLLSQKGVTMFWPGLVWNGLAPINSFWDNVGTKESDIIYWLQRFANVAFVCKRYSVAIRWYELALEYADGDKAAQGTLLINKAGAFLSMGCFKKALEACDQALVVDKDKAGCRRVKALLGLGRLMDVASLINDQITKHPKLKEDRAFMRFVDPIGNGIATESPYEWVEFLMSSNATNASDVVIPEYIGPIQLHNGRGCFATEDIAPGQLLILKTYFARVVAENAEGSIPVEESRCAIIELEGEVANRLAFSREDMCSKVYSMWAGPELDALTESNMIQTVDMKRIRGVISYNNLVNQPGLAAILDPYQLGIRHSCADSNVIIRATETLAGFYCMSTKPIKKGEELKQVTVTLHQTGVKERAEMEYGVRCDCRICSVDPGSAELKTRRHCLKFMLMDLFKNNKAPSRGVVGSALDILSQIEALAPSYGLSLIYLDQDIFALMIHCLFGRGMYAECVTYCEKVFTVAEIMHVKQCLIDAPIQLMYCNLLLKNVLEARKWREELKKWALILYGSRTSTQVWTQDVVIKLQSFGMEVET